MKKGSSDQIVAVDIGSGYVKAVAGVSADSKRISFPSVVGILPSELLGSFGFDDSQIIEYGGRSWITGQWAAENLRPYQLTNTLNHDWAGSDGWKVLLFRALAELGIYEGDVHLAIGLPQSSFRERSRQIMVELLGDHRAVVHGKPMNIRIVRNEGMVMPQAAAGLYAWSNRDLEIKKLVLQETMLAGVDVGTYTTGYAIMQGVRPMLEKSGGSNIGMSQVAATVSSMLHTQYGGSLDTVAAMRAVEKRNKIFLAGEIRDISDIVAEAVKQVVHPLITMLYAKWGQDAAYMKIGVYGGGARDFFPYIQEIFPNAQLVEYHDIGGSRFLPVLGMFTHLCFKNNWLEEIAMSDFDEDDDDFSSSPRIESSQIQDDKNGLVYEEEEIDEGQSFSDLDAPFLRPALEGTLSVECNSFKLCARIYDGNPLHARIYQWVATLPRTKRGIVGFSDHLVVALNLYLDALASDKTIVDPEFET